MVFMITIMFFFGSILRVILAGQRKNQFDFQSESRDAVKQQAHRKDHLDEIDHIRLTLVEPPYIFCKNRSDFTSKILEDNALFLQVSWKTLQEKVWSCKILQENVWSCKIFQANI